MVQNYRRLGLASRLNSATGGVEKLRPGAESSTSTMSKLAIANAFPKMFEPGEAQVERDPETGKIVRVIHPETDNPLNDPLNSIGEEEGDEEMEEGGERNEVVRLLEEQASLVAEKKERTQSEGEREWIERLVGRHGEDYVRMARDMKLNPMQQTPADIRRRVGKWKKEGGVVPEPVSAPVAV